MGGGQLGNTPKASVLIPAYNVENYLRRILDSILNQTYQDFEIILVDDGSTDSTPQICDEYGRKYDFIHVFHQRNMGLSKTRERLIEKASGEYIFWLDADDYYDHTLLEKAVNAFEYQKADIVVWGFICKQNIGEEKWEAIAQNDIIKWKNMTVWGFKALLTQCASRKELWDGRERFPDDVDLVDDIWLTTQIVSKAERIISLEECLYFYDRTNMDSISHFYTGKSLCRTALGYYRVIKRNLERRIEKDPEAFQWSLRFTRKLLIEAYCVNQVDSSLNQHQIDLIKNGIKDLLKLDAQKKVKKFYLIQLAAIYGINFFCRMYGNSRIRKYYRNK